MPFCPICQALHDQAGMEDGLNKSFAVDCSSQQLLDGMHDSQLDEFACTN